MVVVVVVVVVVVLEKSKIGEEAGDQMRVSRRDGPLSVDARNCGELTLENRDSNCVEGLVTAFRPRKRAKSSQRRIACRTWRCHWGI
jgi:hypothetical protein